MKYAEFKSEVEKLGFKVVNRTSSIDYIIDGGSINWIVASVVRRVVCSMSTEYHSDMIDEERLRQLFHILVKFAQTTYEARCYTDV